MHKLIVFFYAFIIVLFSCSKNISEEKVTETISEKPPKGWKHYQSPDLTLDYPKPWFLTVDTSDGEIFHISRPEEKPNGIVAYDISLTYYPKEVEFEKFAQSQIQTMKEDYHFQLRKEERISFDSKDAFKLLMEFPTDAGRNESAEVYLINGKEKYYWMFNAGDEKYKLQADSIIQEIHLR